MSVYRMRSEFMCIFGNVHLTFSLPNPESDPPRDIPFAHLTLNKDAFTNGLSIFASFSYALA